MRSLILVFLVAGALLAPAAAFAYDPQTEWDNYSRAGQRYSYKDSKPERQQTAATAGVGTLADILARDAAEGGERFSGSLCGAGVLLCGADTDFAEWDGTERRVTYVNRNGAHIEGTIWSKGDATGKPGIVIQTGSVQAPERWYRWAGQVLARNGYVAMTFDVQGQGRSDLFGTHDSHAFDGVPAQDIGHFVEDLEDAIDFFHSTPEQPYDPGTAHGRARQDKRAAAGKVDRFNPLHEQFDGERFGIAGHSLGAGSVSRVQGTDPRVDAVVAWDDLESGEGVRPRVPALGMAGDYYIVPQPYGKDPDRGAKSDGFRAWKAAGLPAMQVNLRGGTHFEWSPAAHTLPATLRGIDVSAWYTVAWFDRFVKGDATASGRLLSDRWRHDDADPDGPDFNHFSFYYDSPLSLDGVDCADQRVAACPLQPDDGPAYAVLEDR